MEGSLSLLKGFRAVSGTQTTEVYSAARRFHIAVAYNPRMARNIVARRFLRAGFARIIGGNGDNSGDSRLVSDLWMA